MRHSRIDITCIQFQIDLTINQTFIIFMIIAKSKNRLNREYWERNFVQSNEIISWLIRCNRWWLTIRSRLCINFLSKRHYWKWFRLLNEIRTRIFEESDELNSTRFVTNSHCCCKTNQTSEWRQTTMAICIYRMKKEIDREKKKENADKSTRGYFFFFDHELHAYLLEQWR
jgi:hypothetical protein